MRRATAAIVRAPGARFAVEEVELDAPREHEVVVRILGCGICHTDLHARDQHIPFRMPAILGHEGAGIVEEVGARVTRLRRGDSVVLSYAFCRDCELCASERMAYCTRSPRLNFGGARTDGSAWVHDMREQPLAGGFIGQSAFATRAVVHESSAVRVGGDLPIELMGPLGCGMQTGAGAVVNVLQAQPGTSIAIFGVGSVGLAAVMAARIAGCSTIIAVDLNESRLQLARELGATHACNASNDDVATAIAEITRQRGTHYSVECTGVPRVLRQALDALRPCGTCVSLGVAAGTGEATISMNALLRGRTLRGATEGDSVTHRFIPQLIEWWRAGRFPFERLVQYFDLADINAAVDACASGAVVKPIVRPA